MARLLWACGLLLACAGGLAQADIVHLKNGAMIEGEVVDEGDSIVIIRGSARMRIAKSKIARIEKKKLPAELYAEKAAQLGDEDAAGHYELALWCREKKLNSQWKAELLKVIQLEPEHEEARVALGHVRYEGRWVTPQEKERLEKEKYEAEMRARGLVKYQDRWVTPEEKENLEQGLILHEGEWLTEEEVMEAKGFALHEGEWIPREEKESLERDKRIRERLQECARFNEEDRKKDGTLDRTRWENAFECQTIRYHLRCNISRELTDEVAQHMQQSWWTYEEIFPVVPPDGSNLPTMPVRIYREEEQFREVTGQPNATGVYAHSYIGAFKKPDDAWAMDLLLLVLDHEACHYYLDMAFPGQTPRWLDEGCAVYFSVTRMTNMKYKQEYVGGFLDTLREAIAGNGKFYSVSEVLDFNQAGYAYGTGETDEEKKQDRDKHYGQSLLLCSYLLREGESEKSEYRNILRKTCEALHSGESMRAAHAIAFEGVDQAVFEEAWKRYIAETPLEELLPTIE